MPMNSHLHNVWVY